MTLSVSVCPSGRNTRWICSTRFATWWWSWSTWGGSCCLVTWRRTRAETSRDTSPSGWTGATSEDTHSDTTWGNVKEGRGQKLLLLSNNSPKPKDSSFTVRQTREKSRKSGDFHISAAGTRSGLTVLLENWLKQKKNRLSKIVCGSFSYNLLINESADGSFRHNSSSSSDKVRPAVEKLLMWKLFNLFKHIWGYKSCSF